VSTFRGNDRDNFFKDVAAAHRAWTELMIALGLARGDHAVSLGISHLLTSRSKVWDRIYATQIAELTGQKLTHTARTLRKYAERGALIYQGGSRDNAGWIALPTSPLVTSLGHLSRKRSVTQAGHLFESIGDQRRSADNDRGWSPSEKLIPREGFAEDPSHGAAADAADEEALRAAAANGFALPASIQARIVNPVGEASALRDLLDATVIRVEETA